MKLKNNLEFKFNRYYFFSVFLIISFIITTYYNYIHFINLDAWSNMDWLINYEGGFVRRGLLGEFIFLFSSITSQNPSFLVFIIQTILYFVFFLFSYKIIIIKKYLDKHMLLSFSPFLFYFQVFDPAASGRKEIIYLAILSVTIYYAVIYSREKFEKVFLVIVSIYPLLILTHEIFIIYLIYLIIIYIIKVPLNKRKFIFLLMLIFLSIASFISMLFYKGDLLLVSKIIDSLNNFSLNINSYDENAISALAWTLESTKNIIDYRVSNEFFIEKHLIFLFVSIIGYIPLFYKLRKLFENQFILCLFLLSLVATIILMAVAWDWRRFIYIHFISIFFVSFLIQGNKDSYNYYIIKYEPIFVVVYFIGYTYLISHLLVPCILKNSSILC